jgi:orotate phosphoribosyltransferase
MSATGLELIGHTGLETLRARAWEPRFVGGLTLGADPVAYAIALASRQSPPEIDAFTIRKEPKEHGLGRQVEGCFEAGASVVVVEDVLTTGGSALAAIAAIEHDGGHVLGVLALIERDDGGRAAIEAAGFQLQSIVTLADLGLG